MGYGWYGLWQPIFDGSIHILGWSHGADSSLLVAPPFSWPWRTSSRPLCSPQWRNGVVIPCICPKGNASFKEIEGAVPNVNVWNSQHGRGWYQERNLGILEPCSPGALEPSKPWNPGTPAMSREAWTGSMPLQSLKNGKGVYNDIHICIVCSLHIHMYIYICIICIVVPIQEPWGTSWKDNMLNC